MRLHSALVRKLTISQKQLKRKSLWKIFDMEMAVINEHFGRRLKLRREALGVDRTVLANLLNCSEVDIHEYENGSRVFDGGLLLKISDILEAPVSWFYDGLGQLEKAILQSGNSDKVAVSNHAASVLAKQQRGEVLSQYFEDMDKSRQMLLIEVAHAFSTNSEFPHK